ncbi:MAG: acetolactate synthase [Oscillospiraceae bacterium]|nr:acetolactate synthase [Oscillospiraceae bacterium]
MSVKQISVFLENKPGELNALTQELAKHHIDMRAMSLSETNEFGIARLIVDRPLDTATVLKDAGYVCTVTSVLAVAIPHVPGGLNQVLNVLSEAGINLEYGYAFLGGQKDSAYMIFRVTDNAAATAALSAKGIHVVEPGQLEAL